MNLCSKKHTEVCFEDHNDCPVCEAMEEAGNLRDEVARLEKEVEKLSE